MQPILYGTRAMANIYQKFQSYIYSSEMYFLLQLLRSKVKCILIFD